MTNTQHSSVSTQFKVGLFSVLGLLLIGAVTVLVNDKPFWWRSCDLVHINVEDATGLKSKSPIRSLGLEIGYLSTVELTETYVRLGICITAPVEVLPSTRAYIRAEGFLGDKFVELKPVRYVGSHHPEKDKSGQSGAGSSPVRHALLNRMLGLLISEARAEEPQAGQPPQEPASPPAEPAAAGRGKRNAKEIPMGKQSQDVQHLVQQVDDLVNEMTSLTNNLKEAINPQDLRKTMAQLNRTLENASKTLSPEGGLNTTAQRTLAKLEDAIEQMRDQLARVNRGEGSLGMVLNDPSYALQLKEVLTNANKLLTKVGNIRFVVNVGAEEIPAYDGGRGWFQLQVWPKDDRYYLLGVSIDPRGKRTVIDTKTTSGGASITSQTVQVEQGGILFTAMLGKLFWRRIDLSIGVLHGDGTVSAAFRLGPDLKEEMLVVRSDTYSRGRGFPVDDRVEVVARPWIHTQLLSAVYLRGGLESVRAVEGKTGMFYGAGLTFDDDDIKLLFTLR